MSDRSNPWLSPSGTPPTAAPPLAAPGAPVFLPPSPPPPAVHRQIGAVPMPEVRLGSWSWPPQGTVSWWALGVHGGAGTTTLLRVLTGGADAQRRWPDVQGTAGGVQVLLIARTDARGLDAAQQAVQEFAACGAPASVEIAGLVLMADAPGKLPGPLRDRIRMLEGACSRIWQVPWVPELREQQPPKRPVKELGELGEFLRDLAPPSAVRALPAPQPGTPADPDPPVYVPAPPAPAPPAPATWAWPSPSAPGPEGHHR